MNSSRWIALVVLVALAATLLVLGGCPSQPKTEGPAVVPPKPPGPAAGQPAAGGKFVWSDKPALADIPAGEITGMLNGKPFTAKSVWVEKKDKETTLMLSDAVTKQPGEVIVGDTGVDLSFTLPEGKPGELVLAIADKKDFDQQHAYYHYPQGGDKGPMSVNADWGVALQITDWTLKPDAANPDVLGKIKGKVAICFDDDTKSWVAGSFDTAYIK